MLRRSTRSLRAAVLAVATLSALSACRRHDDAAGTPQLRPTEDAAPMRLTSVVARAHNMPTYISATGTLTPGQQSEVTPIVSGRVVEVLVERGDLVQLNQPLLRLRDVDFRTNAAMASAAMEQARARLGIENGRFDATATPEVRSAAINRDLAEDTLRRTEQLGQSGAVSEAELTRVRTQAAAAREQYRSAVNNSRASFQAYRSAQSSLQNSQRAVSDSIVRAPFAGEIAERRANVGEYVSPQRAVVTLVATNPLRMELQVPQERTPWVRRGQRVEISVDGFTETFSGEVRYISAALRADSRSLIVEAVVPNESGRLRPGLFATARIALEQQQQAVEVPMTAVLSQAGTHRVFVIVDGRVQERVVTLAERRGETALLTQGVQANEVVATERLDRLADGVRVVQ